MQDDLEQPVSYRRVSTAAKAAAGSRIFAAGLRSRASGMKDTRKPEPEPEPDGWARGEREGYGEPCGVISLSLSLSEVLLEGGMLL